MFTREQYGKVNAEAVGEYGPEELLVVAADIVRRLERGWNVFEGPDGNYYRVADAVGECAAEELLVAAGNPPYPPFAMTAADLAGVRVEKFSRSPALGADRPFVVGVRGSPRVEWKWGAGL